MHRFPIHLTFDGDTDDDDPGDDDDTDDDDTGDDDTDDDNPHDQPYWDMLDFITTAIISGGIPDIIRTDKIPFGGNDDREYDLERNSHHDKIPWSHDVL